MSAFEKKAPGFQRLMHVFCCPAQRVTFQGFFSMALVSQEESLAVDVLARQNAQRHAVDVSGLVPDPHFTRLEFLESDPDWGPLDHAVSPQTDHGRNAHAAQGHEPLPTDELSVSGQEECLALEQWEQAFDQRDAGRHVAVAAMRQQGPDEREAEGLPPHTEQENIDVLLTELPIGAVQDEQQTQELHLAILSE